MGKMLATKEISGFFVKMAGKGVKCLGHVKWEQVIQFLNLPITKGVCFAGIGWKIGKEVMANGYSTTLNLGFLNVSLTKNPSTKETPDKNSQTKNSKTNS